MYGDFIFFGFFIAAMAVFAIINLICQMIEEAKKKKIPEIPEEEKGFYCKYYVKRYDNRDQPGGDRSNARYFVLDYINDYHSIAALRSYIESLEREGKFNKLAEDLRIELDKIQKNHEKFITN
jgi:hypothetical protein